MMENIGVAGVLTPMFSPRARLWMSLSKISKMQLIYTSIKMNKKKNHRNKLKKESKKVRKNSRKVLAAFEKLEDLYLLKEAEKRLATFDRTEALTHQELWKKLSK